MLGSLQANLRDHMLQWYDAVGEFVSLVKRAVRHHRAGTPAAPARPVSRSLGRPAPPAAQSRVPAAEIRNRRPPVGLRARPNAARRPRILSRPPAPVTRPRPAATRAAQVRRPLPLPA